MDFELYKTTRDFSTEYGTFLGLIWITTVAVTVFGMMNANPLLMMMSLGMMGISVLAPLYFAWRYKQHLPTGHQVSYGMAWMFAALMFLYASIITGVGEFIYLNFYDHGRLIDFFCQVLSAPETVEQYRMIGAEQILTDTREQMTQLADLSPLDLTLNLFANNITLSLLYSVPVAFVAHMTSR